MFVYSFEEDVPLKSCKDKQYSFLKRAMNLAQKSTCEQQRHGCVIVKDDDIISEGFNYKSEHFSHCLSIHAEVAAIAKLGKRKRKFMSQCDMYVVRIGRDSMGNPLKYSKPCPNCMKAIQKAGLRKVYYSTNREFDELMLTMSKLQIIEEPSSSSSSDAGGSISSS